MAYRLRNDERGNSRIQRIGRIAVAGTEFSQGPIERQYRAILPSLVKFLYRYLSFSRGSGVGKVFGCL